MADFGRLTVGAFRKDGDISFVQADDTITSALQVIFSRDVYSVPVYDKAQGKYIGLLDLVDLVGVLLGHFQTLAGVKTAQELAGVVSSQFKKDLGPFHQTFFDLKIRDVMAQTQSAASFKIMPHTALVSEVIAQLTADTRRVPIENQGKVVQMVSQADIVRFIHSSHMQTLENKLKSTVGKHMHKAIDILPTTRTLDAFAIMNEAKVSALPIVDRAAGVNQLIGVVTLKDIKGALEDLKTLFIPIEDYIAHMRQRNLSTLREFPFISMQDHDSLEKAVNKMMAARIHRVFIKKPDDRDLYVLSLKDILQAMLR